MAEGRELEDLKKEITCVICHEHFTEPKALPCLHYYCKECLHSLALRTGLDKPFSCPECRKPTTLPQGKVDNLLSAFFINRLKEKYFRLERAYGKVEAKCGACVEGGKAEAFCMQCAEFICAKCVNHHREIKVFISHKILSFDELKEGGAKGAAAPEPSLQTCTVHEQPMNIYCFDCKTLICRDCTIKTHNSQTHNYEFVKVAAPAIKKKLIQQLDPLKEAKKASLDAVKEAQTAKSDIKTQGKSVIDSINSSFDEIIAIVKQRRQELLTEADEIVTSKCDNLSSQEEKLSTRHTRYHSAIDYTEHCVEHAADDEIMCMHGELQSLIEEQITEHQKEEKNLNPVEAADMRFEVRCVQELKQLCQDKAIITSLLFDPTKHIVEMKECTDVNKLSKFTVTPKLINGDPPALNQQCVIKCELKSLVEGTTIKCQVSRGGDNKYHCEYTPTVRGRHELTVSVNGQEVAGSPFPVFVSIHPTQLGNPVRVITTEKLPHDVAVSSAGEVVVTFSKNIVVYDKSGNKLRSSEAFDFKTAEFWSVTIDNNPNNIFLLGITDDSHKIVRLGLDLKIRKEVSFKGVINFTGMTVVGDELMMCNSVEGCIMVYNKELEYMRLVSSKGNGTGQLGDTRGLSSDAHGNLYVCDRTKFSVQVFSNAGEFLRSLTSNSPDQLRFPFGVCVSGQYVYVCNYEGSTLIVFTTEGDYVTEIGKKGQEKGDFSSPWGVCVDKDGYVYVCDNENKRVQIF